jgi:formamidopyrimidine-DNA glycosylase
MSLSTKEELIPVMPELPEVETVRRGLSPILEQMRFILVEVNRPDLRFAFPASFGERLEGRSVLRLERRAKYILAHLDDGAVLIMHLGMSGRFIIEDGSSAEQPGRFHDAAPRRTEHDHVVLHMSNGMRVIYNDVRRFGFMDLACSDKLGENRHFRALGLEPLGNEFNASALARLFAHKKTPLKAALLDQSLIAGLGNIYVCEALHRAHLSPLREAGTLTLKDGEPRPEAERLATSIRAVLGEAIEAGGSTLRDFAHADGSLGYFQHQFRAYGQAGAACRNEACGGRIERIVQSGRSTFYCVRCQT